MTTILILISHNICYVLFHHLLLDSSESLRLKLCWRDEFVLHLHPHIYSVMRIWCWYSMQSWHISSLSSFTWTDARIIITRSMDYYDTILLLGKNTFLFCWWVLKSVWQIFPHGLGQVFAGHMAWILTLLAEAISRIRPSLSEESPWQICDVWVILIYSLNCVQRSSAVVSQFGDFSFFCRGSQKSCCHSKSWIWQRQLKVRYFNWMSHRFGKKRTYKVPGFFFFFFDSLNIQIFYIYFLFKNFIIAYIVLSL